MSPEKMSRSDRFAWRLVEAVTRRPWTVAGLAALSILVAVVGAANLEFSNNYRVFFSPENPELIAFNEFQDTYTKNDNIMFVLKADGEDVFTPRIADAVEELTRQAWQIPYAIRVDSISNFQHSWADGDDLTVEDLIRDASSLSEEDLAERRDVALSEPLLRGNLISPDADTTGINVTIQYPELSLNEVPETAAAARRMAAKIEADYPGVRVAITGVSMLNNAFAEAGIRDSMTLMPLMFGVLVLFMVIALRSVGGTLVTLTIIAGSAGAALGLAGWAGLKLTPISVTAPIIIMTLAIADSIHVLVAMFSLMQKGMEKIEALKESFRINFVALVITSVTTIVGFLGLNFSDAPPFRDLGNITAMGIAAALIYSLTLLPALIAILPVKVRRAAGGRAGLIDRGLSRLAGWVTCRYRPVLVGTSLLALVLIALVPMIELNDEWVKYFDHRVPFRGDAEFAMDNLNGIYLVEYSLESGKRGGINEPDYLAGLERFSTWLSEQPGVTHVYSYSDIIKRLNRNMHGDDAAYYRIPEDRELAAQYLLLYEMSLPYGLDLNDRINIDKSATRVTASVGEISTAQVRELIDRADVWLAENEPSTLSTHATGATVMFSHISERNIHSMLRGNVIALLLIAGIMVFALRSVGMGALSILPNALPVLMTFGLWALLVRQVGMAAATVTATSLGIVVDDTVHFLAKYLRARREMQLDRPEAIRYAFETVGRAIISTSIILSFGFAMLALSTFRINAQMGLLTALTILIALPSDLLLLPSLLMIGYKTTRQEVTNHEEVLAHAS